MAIIARADQFIVLYNRFWSLGVDGFFNSGPVYSDYDGPNVEECKELVAFVKSTFDPLVSTREIRLIGMNGLINLQSSFQNVYNTFDQLQKSRDQGSFQNFASNIDAFCLQTRSIGVQLLSIGGAQVEAVRAQLQSELDRARSNNTEIEELTKSVRNLVSPAVAGSLSAEFSARRNTIGKQRMAWLAAVAILGGFATYTTYDLVTTVVTLLQGFKPSGGISDPTFWAVILIRTLVLVPVLASFGFAFNQYRKEREFEEDYAHKAAVAQSLPNYGDLARQGTVRDQIVTAATSVIFVSPTEQSRKIEQGNALIGGMKEVVDVLGKAASRK